jgi:UDP-2-acetamido-2-deoxy-ribo-hexuluronate aminotransferase
MGAKVIFVDVTKENYTLDIEQVEDAITERTKLIIPVSIFGNIADMKSINALALQHDLCVIEDAAESFGSAQDGRRSCQLSKLATTSFFPTMPLNGFGNGAALFIEDKELRDKARLLRSQGRDGNTYRGIGIEACIDTLQAAIVNYKISHVDEEQNARKEIAQNFTSNLRESNLKLPDFTEESNFAYYPVISSDRADIVKKLQNNDIEYKVPFSQPLHLHPAFTFMRYAHGDFPISERLAETLVLLPLHAYLSKEEQQSIINTLQ